MVQVLPCDTIMFVEMRREEKQRITWEASGESGALERKQASKWKSGEGRPEMEWPKDYVKSQKLNTTPT